MLLNIRGSLNQSFVTWLHVIPSLLIGSLNHFHFLVFFYVKKVCEESYVKKVPEEIRELGLLPQTFNFGLKENFIQSRDMLMQ